MLFACFCPSTLSPCSSLPLLLSPITLVSLALFLDVLVIFQDFVERPNLEEHWISHDRVGHISSNQHATYVLESCGWAAGHKLPGRHLEAMQRPIPFDFVLGFNICF